MKEDNTQSEKFSLHERLRSLNTTEFYDLLSNLLVKKPELYQLVPEWFKEKHTALQPNIPRRSKISISMY